MTAHIVNMTRRKKDPGKREALLTATLSLINDNGFHAAPMSKIAKLAQVSPATIYIYFENKQDLVNQLYLTIKEKLSLYAFKEYSPTEPVKSCFKKIWFNIARYRMQFPQESAFLTQCDSSPMVENPTREEALKHLKILLDVWDRGKTEGHIKNIDPYLLYAFTLYPMSFLITSQQRNLYTITDGALQDAFNIAWDSIKTEIK
ncbi:TetR/AcrR family transcriptional regulator [Aquimarina sp. W85]|uniref:TetR/AcrR family transcriptional regulator n=1 Tax=Aquimarina rhodophyticola TaxID=3342246 RepID=UPI00366D6034